MTTFRPLAQVLFFVPFPAVFRFACFSIVLPIWVVHQTVDLDAVPGNLDVDFDTNPDGTGSDSVKTVTAEDILKLLKESGNQEDLSDDMCSYSADPKFFTKQICQFRCLFEASNSRVPFSRCSDRRKTLPKRS